jgi:metal-responsive CopG/Arc/MetJ family transcriptional regulator
VSTETINVRVPSDLIPALEAAVEREREATGIPTISRNEVIVKAIRIYVQASAKGGPA